MSNPPRAFKRPRDTGMEGSTIVIPSHSNAPQQQTDSSSLSSSLILMLAQSCQKHNEQHAREGPQEGEERNSMPSSCLTALTSLGRIIPKVEKAYSAASNPKPADILHLCDFYLSVVQRSFCPSALKLFDYGRNPAEIISRVLLLLQHILSPNNRQHFKSQWRRPIEGVISLFDRLCHTAANLLGVPTDTRLYSQIFADLVHTIYDLSVLMDSGYFDSAAVVEPVEIVVFAETLAEDQSAGDTDSAFSLHLDSLDAAKLLRAALLKILCPWMNLLILKQVGSFPEAVQKHHTSTPDSFLAAVVPPDGTETFSELLSTLSEILQRPFHKKSDYRDDLGRYAAVEVVHAILEDYQRVGASDVHVVLDLCTLIAQTSLDFLQSNQESQLAEALGSCIQSCVASPPRFQGWSLSASHLAVWRAICPVLLECVPMLPDVATVSTQKLGSAILYALGNSFDKHDERGFLHVSNYPRALDPDFIEALFLLLEDRTLAKHAVWICAIVIDGAQDVFNTLDSQFMFQRIQEISDSVKTFAESDFCFSGSTRKRRRSNTRSSKGESPTKQIRVRDNASVEVATRRVHLLQSGITDIFGKAFVASSRFWKESHTADVVLCATFIVAAAANLIALSSYLSSDDTFQFVFRGLVSYMESFLRHIFSANGENLQSTDEEAIRLSVDASFWSIRKTRWPRCVELQKLFGQVKCLQLLVRPECPLSIVSEFPLVDELSQSSRILLLRQHLKTDINRVDDTSDLTNSTVEILRQPSFAHDDPMVRLLYWQSGAWLLHCSTDLERHLTMAGDNPDLAASKLVKFLISTPFSDLDEKVRMYTSSELGNLLVSNPSIRAVLSGAAQAVHGGCGAKTSGMLNLAEGLEETRLFRDIDALLHQHCRIPQSQLSFTVGLSLGSNSDDGKALLHDNAGFHQTGLRSLASLFRAFFGTGDSRGEMISENAFLRLLRLWIFFGQHRNAESSCFAFGEVARVLSSSGVPHRKQFLMHVAPATFRDVLFPSSVYFASQNQGISNPFLEQLENQCHLLYIVIGKFLSVGDYGEFTRFGGFVMNGIEESFDSFLPSALAQLIMEKDYDVLRSLTAFSRYVLNRRRESIKGKRNAVATAETDRLMGLRVSKSKVWAQNLELQTMELCTAPDVTERLLPLLLMHAGPDEDRFFTKHVLLNKLSLPKILQARGQLVLKGLIKEFGSSDEVPSQIMWALKKAAVAKGLSQEESSISDSTHSNSNDDVVSSWISENFMHLLVNLVQSRWREKSPKDKVCALRCLRAMVRFLKTAGSSQFVPQVMSTVNASIRDSEDEMTTENMQIRDLAVQILDRLVRLVWEDNWEVVGEHLTSIVVALIPVLTDPESGDSMPLRRRPGKSVENAVSLLQWLAQGEHGQCLAPFFKKIPFLPSTPALDPVKASLAEVGVDFEGLRLTMTETSLSRFSTQSDIASTSVDSKSVERLSRVKSHLQSRLSTVRSLLSNENSSIRLNALKHLISLLKTYRGVFHTIIDTEESSCMGRFLTVCSNEVSANGRGVVSDLVTTLLSRAALETNQKIRVLVAKAFGELGAISQRFLNSYTRSDAVSKGIDERYSWRLRRPPWSASPADYLIALMTEQLVSALKAAPTSVDHQKIGFSMQEVLALSSSLVYVDANEPTGKSGAESVSTPSGLPEWLSTRLEKAGVMQIVEPFLNSEFCEKDPFNPSPPPFFSKARSYYEWLSNWIRFMIHRSRTNRDSDWCKLLYACRLAFKTHSGLGISEFLLPVIVLDRICFGNVQDENCILHEISDVFKYQLTHESPDAMSNGERQKAVATLFSLVDTLRHWSEKDTEDRYRGSFAVNSSKNRRGSGEGWSADEAVMRIEDVLKAIPFSLQAKAAAESGMYARSIRLLEMASRSSVVDLVYNETTPRESVIPTRSISSGKLSNDIADLMKDNLATLGDYDTLSTLSEEDAAADAMTKALDSIRQKESSKDWSGALQDYERAHHFEGNPHKVQGLMQGTLSCLLELGQFESVLRQVKGATASSDINQPHSLVPFAVEASWRLGRWETLSELIGNEKDGDQMNRGDNVQVEVGRAMLAIHQKHEKVAMHAIDRAREAVLLPLSSTAKESYSRAYSHIVKLHSLREMEDAVPIICDETADTDLATFVSGSSGGFWAKRLDFVDPSSAATICHSRLALARLAGKSGLEASLFLAVGRRARKDHQYSIAASALAQAETSFELVNRDHSLDDQRCETIMQLAKLKYEVGESSAALRLLHMDEIESMSDLDQTALENETIRRVSSMLRKRNHGLDHEKAIKIFRKSALISTKWMIDGGVKDCAEIVERFRTIHKVAPKWEKGHFQFAKYVETMLFLRIEALQRRSKGQLIVEDDSFRHTCLSQDRLCQKYLNLAVKHYIEALTLNLKHLFQALPRLLSLWFEFSSVSIDVGHSEPMSQDTIKVRNNLKNKQSELTELVAKRYRSIPAEAFYSALPQLVSRTTDSNGDLRLVIQNILSRVLTKFPGQAMWPLAWLLKSKDSVRKQMGEVIFKEAEKYMTKTKRPEVHLKLLVACKSLFNFLQDLAKYPVKDNKKTVNIRPWVGEVPLSEFVPPIQAALSPTLTPVHDERGQKDPFPSAIPRMKEFVRGIGVMMSKARPKKLKATAVMLPSNPRVKESNAQVVGEFHFLIKQEAKGDLRKDARVQDLNNVINRLLLSTKRTGETSRHRHLRLRTFTVTCLSEDTGILEWVPHTNSLRNLVMESYNPQASPFSAKRRGHRMANSTDAMMRSNYAKCQEMFFGPGDLKKAARLFQDLMVKSNPPLLYWWFVEKFQDPHQWYEARTLFTLSAAVWSAVGHVIGLGDRHSENILVDTASGEMVHVDFDCIFDKGLNLPKPEVVPFRLTANMVDAFGPVGADGIYAASLKDAMATLRSNRDTLLSVLEPFVKDPIIDWKRTRTQQKSSTQPQDRQVKDAKRSIKVIDERLQGVYNLKNPNLKKIQRSEMDGMNNMLKLTVDGQVHKMIAEATSSENLVQLYVGWMPWI